jgi:hypothetical protein
MPTGYTAEIYEGKKEVTFQDYAMGCARAFGACILMRDDPKDTPIPDAFPVDSYHVRALASAKVKLAKLKKMPLATRIKQADKFNAEALKSYEESVTRNATLRKRYEDMLKQAQAWEPPTAEHTNFKEFMVSQLKDSINFDCHVPSKPSKVSTGAWFKQQIESAEWDIKYHEKQYQKEVKNVAARNAWIATLRESLQSLV